MAAFDREAIYAALYARLQSSLGATITTYSRQVLDLDEMPATQQPALLSLATDDDPDYGQPDGLPPRWYLGALVVIYLRAQPDEAAGPETKLNGFIKAIETALLAVPGEGVPLEYATTLGGLVEWCRISGKIERHPGVRGDQAAVLIPLQMLKLP
jgi:hypothetical protein